MAEQASERSIFEAAIEKGSAEERAAYLNQACGGNRILLKEVEALLAVHDRLGGVQATLDEPPVTEHPGTVIGPYKLLEQIGEGGFGVVFMAEQSQPVRRKVALKILKPGMDTRHVVARFEAERQALALMDHANIARVLDGGQTASGRPYFVMDLVKGLPITDYCDQAQLTTNEQLGLFVDLCRAVQHAHQKGVIHRDLKPSNVLVTVHDTAPVVKVIDFGVAKALGQELTDKTLFTGFAQMLGTPLYMSPEQAGQSGLDVDTRSDIYSLGVLLYELLTGTTPFDKDRFKQVGFDELRRIIREEEPPKPSTRISTLARAATTLAMQRKSDPRRLSQLFRGELDWIVMKALEKDRNRRYETASGLALDVQRYLADEPVQACPPSAWYRFRKFAKRNRTQLSLASVLGVALLAVVATVAGSIGWVTRDRAAQRARSTGQVELILKDVERLEREQKWPSAAAAAERADAILAGGEVDDAVRQRAADIRRHLAFVATLDRVRQERAAKIDADVDRREGRSNYRYVRAARNYALAFREYGVDMEALPTGEAIERLRRNPLLVPPIAVSLDDWVRARRKLDEDEPGWRKLVAVARALDPEPLRDRLRAAWLQPVIPELKADLKRLAESIDVKAQDAATILALARTLYRAELPDAALKTLQHGLYAHPADFFLNLELAERHYVRKEYEEAHVYCSAAVSLRPDSAVARNNLGNVLKVRGKLDEAVACYQNAVELDPQDVLPRANLGLALHKKKKLDEAGACFRKIIQMEPKHAPGYYGLGNVLRDQKKTNEAIACFRKAIELDPKNASFHINLGVALHHQRKLGEAIACYLKAIDLDSSLALPHYNLGNAFRDQNKLDDAMACYRKAVELDEKLALAHHNLGLLLKRQGQTEEAIAAYRRALAHDPDYVDCRVSLGAILCDVKHDYEGAIAEFRRALALDAKNPAAHMNLGVALSNQGNLKEAVTCFRKAIALEPKYARAHFNLGLALRAQEKLDEAIAACRDAMRWEPKNSGFRQWLIGTLAPLGRLEDARAAWEYALSGNPPEYEAWHGYAELCLFLKKEDAYRRIRRALLERFSQTIDPALAVRIARAVLVLPGTEAEIAQAVALVDRALATAPKSQYGAIAAVKALAEYRLGQFESAIDWGKKAGDWGVWVPTHLVLAMAHQRLGHADHAKKALAEALKTYGQKHMNESAGIVRPLRREAEALLNSAGKPPG